MHSLFFRTLGVLYRKLIGIIQLFEPESRVFPIFIAIHLFISSNKYYIGASVLYILVLYLINKKIHHALWITYLSSVPFQQAKYFSQDILIRGPTNFMPTVIFYYVSIADIILLALLYVLKRNGTTLLKTNKSSLDYRMYLSCISILILGAVSSWMSNMPMVSFFGLFQLTKYFVLYLLSRNLFSDKRLLKIGIEILFIFITLNAGLVIIEKIHGGPLGLQIEKMSMWSQVGRFADENQDLYRPGGMTDDPNLIASLLTMYIPFFLTLGVTESILSPIIIWPGIAVSGIALLITASRASTIIAIVLTLLTIVFLKKLNLIRLPQIFRKRILTIFIIIMLCAMPFVIQRISTLTQAFSENGGGTYRKEQILHSLAAAKSNLTGLGLNVFQYHILATTTQSDYPFDNGEAHNLFAQILSGLGFVGLILFAILFLSILNTHVQALRSAHYRTVLPFGTIAVILCYIAVASFYPWFLYMPIAELFWISAGYPDSIRYGTKH